MTHDCLTLWRLRQRRGWGLHLLRVRLMLVALPCSAHGGADVPCMIREAQWDKHRGGVV